MRLTYFGTSLRETLYHKGMLCIFVLLLDVSFGDKRAFYHSPSSTEISIQIYLKWCILIGSAAQKNYLQPFSRW